jgi:hypothetical protein
MTLKQMLKEYADQLVYNEKDLVMKDQDGHFSVMFKGDDDKIAFQFQDGFVQYLKPEPQYEVVGLFRTKEAVRYLYPVPTPIRPGPHR